MNKRTPRFVAAMLALCITFGSAAVSAASPEAIPPDAHTSSELQSSISAQSSELPASSLPDTEPDAKYTILILQPSGWYTKSADVDILITDVNGTGYEKAEAKIEKNGSWQDITDDLMGGGSAKVEITENCTVYISVTDKMGKTHSKARYIECFDRDAPTVRAGLDGALLRVEASDSLSGVESIFVNGYRFTSLTNGVLNVRLKDYADSDFELVSVQAVDYAGNKSNTSTIKNPYYKAPGKDDGSSCPQTTKPESSAPPQSSAPPASTSKPTNNGNAGSAATKPVTSSAQSSDKPKDGSVTPTDGTGNTIENSTKNSDEREFFTIETADGSIYYIVVDKQKQSKNVYLLSAVSSDDLMGLAEDKEHGIPDPPEESQPQVSEPEPEPEPTPEPEPAPKKESNVGLIVMVILVFLGVGGAAYYLKIYKPKQEGYSEEEEEPEEFDDDTDDTDDQEYTDHTSDDMQDYFDYYGDSHDMDEVETKEDRV